MRSCEGAIDRRQARTRIKLQTDYDGTNSYRFIRRLQGNGVASSGGTIGKLQAGGKYNEAEIGNEMSVDTKTAETRCNRSVEKKGNDGETTRSEAENAEHELRDTRLRECRKTMSRIVC